MLSQFFLYILLAKDLKFIGLIVSLLLVVIVLSTLGIKPSVISHTKLAVYC